MMAAVVMTVWGVDRIPHPGGIHRHVALAGDVLQSVEHPHDQVDRSAGLGGALAGAEQADRQDAQM